MKTKSKIKSKSKSKSNFILPVILVSSAVFVLFSFKDKISLSPINNIDDTNSSDQNLKQPDEDIDTTSFHKLSVLVNRCRVCGKCIRLDPEHFELINGKSSVISTKNLDSEALKLAVRSCPDQAILLE